MTRAAESVPTLAFEVRRRLVVWMLLPSLVVVLGLGLAAGWAQREVVRTRQAVVAQAAAFLVGGYLDDSMADLKHCLAHLEKYPKDSAEGVLEVLRLSFPRFERLFVLDEAGLTLASSPPGGEGAHFPLERLRESPSGLFKPGLSPFTGLPTVFESVRSATGYTLVGELSLTALQDYAARLASLSTGEEVALTDSFGNILAHPDPNQVKVRANFGHLDILRRAREGGTQFGDYTNRERRRIGTATSVPGTSWLLLVNQSALRVYAPIAVLMLTLSTLLAGFFLLLVFLTEHTLRRRVVQPLAEFNAAIHDIGRGRMSEALPPVGAFRELTQLLDEFNSARQALAVRDAALRASEAKYREIFEKAVEGLFQSTPEGQYVSANPALARILGYDSPADLMADVSDVRAQLYVDPAHREEFLRLLGESGEVQAFETVLRRRDGAHRWCSINARAVRGADGGIVLIEGAVQDVTERKQAEEQLLASLREKEVLLKEVHHRVKNNLQVVSGLLYLQADNLKDPAARAALAESQSRIASMALAHEALYGSDDLARVDLKDYVDRLMSRLVSSLGERGVQVKVEVSAVPLPLTKAIPCGLILNELVTNALKYAFAGPGGRITVSTRRMGSQVELRVADNGRGLPEHITPENASTLGLQLVNNLAGQLRGTLHIGRQQGTIFTVCFPLEE